MKFFQALLFVLGVAVGGYWAVHPSVNSLVPSIQVSAYPAMDEDLAAIDEVERINSGEYDAERVGLVGQ